VQDFHFIYAIVVLLTPQKARFRTTVANEVAIAGRGGVNREEF
jgi:hypothetical protein